MRRDKIREVCREMTEGLGASSMAAEAGKGIALAIVASELLDEIERAEAERDAARLALALGVLEVLDCGYQVPTGIYLWAKGLAGDVHRPPAEDDRIPMLVAAARRGAGLDPVPSVAPSGPGGGPKT